MNVELYSQFFSRPMSPKLKPTSLVEDVDVEKI